MIFKIIKIILSTFVALFANFNFANADRFYDFKYKMKLKANDLSEASGPAVESGGSLLMIFGTVIVLVFVVMVLIAILKK